MKNSLKFDVYFDPGHGWLKTKISLLEKLGIKGKITEYSYVRGDYAYLEEDCDASTFIVTLKNLGIIPSFRLHYGNKSSKIRSYESYPFTLDK